MKKLLNNRLHAIVLFALFLLVPASGYADVVQPTESGQPGRWVDWSTPSNAGVFFWDHQSWDGANCNVGFVLTGGAGPCTSVVPGGILPLNPAPGNIPFWAQNTAGSAAVSDFWFSPSGPQHSVKLEVEIAGYANSNRLGVYFKNSSGGITREQLFVGTDTAPKVHTFTATGDFGFYLVANGNPRTKYYTESSRNPLGGRNLQHFALFRESPKGTTGVDVYDYWLGVEDLALGDADYQDMLVRVHAVAVPEPTSLFQLCTYLLCLAMVLGATRLRKSRG